MKKIYIIGALTKSQEVSVLGRSVDLPMTWADGMIGVMAVFGTIESAKNYAKENTIVEAFVDDDEK